MPATPTAVTLTNLNDTYTAGVGDHVINGQGGNDTITTGAGNSTINVLEGNDTITTGAGDSIVAAGDGNNTITTGAGDSIVTAGDGNNTITTGAGDSIVAAGDGINTITTGAGDSIVTAGDGSNTITTGAGDSVITAGDGDNTVTAGAGYNQVTTGAGNDTITAGAGDDMINAGGGTDIVTAGAGNDVLIYVVAENRTVITNDLYDGGTGFDTLRLVLTRAEWMRADIQSDVANYLAFVAANTGANGEDSSVSFTFSVFALTASKMEKLAVTVDGVAIDPANHAVTLGNYTVSTSENVVAVAVDVLANDAVPDLINTLTYSNPAHGSVQLAAAYSVTADVPSARFIYTPNAGFYDYLALGESATDTFTYTVTDATGDVKTATVTVTITGSNDAPVITAEDLTGAVTEQVAPAGNLTDTGTISFSDLDLTDTHLVSASGTSVGNNLGSLTATLVADTTGSGLGGALSWTYTVADSAVEYLAKNQTRVESFTIALDDQNGSVTTKQIDVTITGTNDVPVATSTTALAGAVTEAGSLDNGTLVAGTATATGTLTATDVDAGASQTWSIEGTSSATYGAIAIDSSTGEWTYTLNNSLVATQALKENETVTQSYTARVTDDFGAYVDQTVTVTITGTNDVPVISNGISAPVTVAITGTNDAPVATSTTALAGAVTEAGSLDNGMLVAGTATATGTLTATDVDAGASQTWSIEGTPSATYGAIAIDSSTGVWTYTLDNSLAATQALKENETITQSYTARVTDDFGAYVDQTVTVTINGTNDVPVISHAAATDIAGSVREEASATLRTGGTLTIADVDQNQSSFALQTATAGTYGAFSVTTDGAWTYTADNTQAAIQQLGATESLTETFTVVSMDGTATQQITVTINGTNDVPTITAASTDAIGAVREDTSTPTLTDRGTIAFNDIDLSDVHTTSVSAVAGNTLGGTLTMGATIESASTSAGSVGWTYNVANSATQYLAAGQVATEKFTVTVADADGGTTSEVVAVTVTGTNDIPVIIAQDLVGAVTAIAEIVTPPASPFLFTVQQYLGYQANNLATLQSYAASHSANYTVQTNVIDFTDDPSGFSGDIPGSVRWPAAQAQNATGMVGVNDSFFARITANFSVTTADTYTFRTYNDDGVFLLIDNTLIISDTGYHPETPFTGSIALAPGNHSIELFFYEERGEASLEFSARSSTGAFGLVGASGGGLGAALAQVTDSGIISFSDLDLTDVHLVSALGAPVGSALGSLSAVKTSDTTGTGTGGQLTWTYTVDDSAIKYLAAGQTRIESFNITLNDQHGGLITKQIDVMINGTNDAPTITAASTVAIGALIEDAGTPNLTKSGTIGFNDVDLIDAHTTSVAAVAGNTLGGTLTMGAVSEDAGTAAGSAGWTYNVANSATQYLAAGQVATEKFTVTVADSHGGTISQMVAVTVTGTNDAPLVAAALTSAANEGAASYGVNLLGGASDVDNGETATLQVASVTYKIDGGTTSAVVPSGLSLSGNTLTVDPSHAAFDSLAAGIQKIITVSYNVTDAHGATVAQTETITITGTNHAPVAINDTASSTEAGGIGNGTPGSNATGNVLTNDTDVDAGASFRVTAVHAGATEGSGATGTLGAALAGAHGNLTLNADGSYNYAVNNSDAAVQALNVGGTLTDTFNYTMTDGSLNDAALLTVTIKGTNDAPLVAAALTSAVNEGAASYGVNLLVSASDVDTGDTATLQVANIAYKIDGGAASALVPSGLSLSGNTLTVDPRHAAFDSLAAGLQKVITVSYNVTDAHGATVAQTETIIITGTNDAPVIGVQDLIGAVTEQVTPAGNLTDSGTISFSDVDLADTHSISAVTPVGSTLGTLTASVSTDTSNTTGLGGQVTWNYSVADSAVEYLAAGETRVETFSFNVLDNNGGSVPSTVSVTINGTNDAPTITAASTVAIGALIEDAGTPNLTKSGTIAFNDVDLIDGHTTSVAAVAGNTLGGTLIMGEAIESASTAVGTVGWTYNVANSATQYLAAGQVVTEKFTVTVADADGGTTSQVVEVSVTGTNDVATISGNSTGAVTEDAVLTTSGTLAVSDVDSSQAVFQAQTAIAGAHGSFGIAATGSWNYVLNNGAANVQALAAGAHTSDSFTVVSLDGSASKVVNIDIAGTNDAPVLAGTMTDPLYVANLDVWTNFLNTDGVWVAPNGGSGGDLALHTLARQFTANQAGNYTFNFSVDNIGSVSVDGIAIPNLQNFDHWDYKTTGTVFLDAGIHTIVMDVQNQGGPASFALEVVNPAGSVVWNTRTHLEPEALVVAYTENQAAQAISSGLNLSDIDSSQMSSATVAIGSGFASSQDKLGFSSQNGISGLYHADTGVLNLSGAATVAQYQAALRSVTFSNSSENPDAAARTINFVVNDGAPQFNLSNTVAGTVIVRAVNDAPVAVNDTASATEAGGIGNGTPGSNASGNVLSNDTDVDSTSFTVTGIRTGSTEGSGTVGAPGVALAGTYGMLTLNASGNYTYTVNQSAPAIQALKVDGTLTDTFNYTMTDGSLNDAALLTVTINGANDAAIITGSSTLSLTETNAILTTGGKLSATDVDSSAAFVVQTGVAGGNAYGKFSIDTTGAWTYAANTAHNEFVGGTTYTDSMTVATADGTTQVVTVSILGANDAPVAINDIGSGSASANAIGNVLSNDTDVDSTSFTVTGIRTGSTEGSGTAGAPGAALAGTYGTLTLNAGGNYTYTVNQSSPAVQALKVDGKLTDIFNYTMTDGSLSDTAVLAITIDGVNHAPVAVADSGTSINANGTVNVTFSPMGSAYASGVSNEYVITQDQTYQAGAIWSNSKISLNASFSISADLYFGTKDGGADGFSFIIQNNSKTTIGASGGGIGYSGITKSVGIEFDTYDNGAPMDIPSDHAAFHTGGTLNAIGSVINLGNIEDGLYHAVKINWNASSQVVTLSYGGNVIGSRTIDVVAQVGANEAYIGFAGSTGTYTNLQKIRNLDYQSANNSVVLDVLVNDTDVDLGDKASLKVVAATSDHGATVNFSSVAGAGIAYSPGHAFDYLATNKIVIDTVTYTIEDSHGAQATSTVQVAITGVNVAPTIVQTVLGDSGNNILSGSGLADYINGLGGNDIITGLAGNDLLTGGAGSDTFVFSQGGGADIITDFMAGVDVIDLSAFASLGYASLADVSSHSTKTGADLVINMGGANSITLTGISLASLQAADFAFA